MRGVPGARARPGVGFLPISAGEVGGGWFPAPEPLIVGGAIARPRRGGSIASLGHLQLIFNLLQSLRG